MSNPTLQVEAVAGSAWGFQLLASTQSTLDSLDLQFGADVSAASSFSAEFGISVKSSSHSRSGSDSDSVSHSAASASGSVSGSTPTSTASTSAPTSGSHSLPGSTSNSGLTSFSYSLSQSGSISTSPFVDFSAESHSNPASELHSMSVSLSDSDSGSPPNSNSNSHSQSHSLSQSHSQSHSHSTSTSTPLSESGAQSHSTSHSNSRSQSHSMSDSESNSNSHLDSVSRSISHSQSRSSSHTHSDSEQQSSEPESSVSHVKSTDTSASTVMKPSVAFMIISCVACMVLGVGSRSFGRVLTVTLLLSAILIMGGLQIYASENGCQSGKLVITYPKGASIFVNGLRMTTCSSLDGSAGVAAPVMQKYVQWLNTFWFASPVVIDLDQNTSCTSNCNEIIVCSYKCTVYDSLGNKIGSDFTVNSARVYTSHIVADIDGNGAYDLCASAGLRIYCWEWDSSTRTFVAKTGFPVSLSGSSYPYISSGEIRGMAAADLDLDGNMELIMSTTNSKIQIYVVSKDGTFYPGWPRYNTDTSDMGDGLGDGKSGRNGMGHYRYGTYGMNVGIGNMDDDDKLEIITTYDDHQIQAFKSDGLAIDMATYFKNPSSKKKLTWGQATARWTNKTTDEGHFHYDSCWPFVAPAGDPCYDATPCVPGGDPWLQFTQSPASVMDIDIDGQAEVLSLPNSELGFDPTCNYVTQYRALFVLDGAYGNGGSPTANTTRDTSSWRTITCQDCYNASCICREEQWYPASSIPAISFGSISGDSNLEMVFSFGDGTISCYDSTATHKWTWDFATYCGINPQVHAIEGSEPALVDLNADGIAEVIFVTWGYPTDPPSAENNQHLFILSNTGTLLHDVPLNTAAAGGGDTSFNGNGNGPCATPTVADLDGDGDLEIVIHTFDGRMLIYTVPGSATNCMLWPTGRGGYMRKGQPDVYYP